MTYLSLFRGDDRTLTIVASEDLTDATVRFTARRKRSDDEAIIEKASPTDITIDTTTATVSIAAADTEDLDPCLLYWDVEVTDVDGKVHTVATGRLQVKGDVTRVAVS